MIKPDALIIFTFSVGKLLNLFIIIFPPLLKHIYSIFACMKDYKSFVLLSALWVLSACGDTASSSVDESFSLKSTVKDALVSVPANLVEVFTSIANPRGVKDAIDESESAGNEGAYKTMQAHFNLGRFQVLAYLLFILLYVPCLAAMGTAFRELGRFYGTLMMVLQTVIGWSLSVLFFQVTCGHSVALIVTSLVLLAGVVVALVVIGRDQRKKKVFE